MQRLVLSDVFFPSVPRATANLRRLLDKIPLPFESNRGQVDPSVKSGPCRGLLGLSDRDCGFDQDRKIHGEPEADRRRARQRGLEPAHFHIGNAVARFERKGDLCAGVLKNPQRLEPAMEKVERLVREHGSIGR